MGVRIASTIDFVPTVIVIRTIAVLAITVRSVAVRQEDNVLLCTIATRGKAVRDRETCLPVCSLVLIGPRRNAAINSVRAIGPALNRLCMSAERNHRHLDLLVLRQLGVVLVQKGVCKNFGGVLGGLHLGGTPLPGPAAAGNLVIHGSGDVHDNHDVDWLAVLGLGRVADDGEGEVVGAISVGADGLVVRRSLVGDVVRRQSRGRRESGHAEQSAKRYSEEYDPPPAAVFRPY